MLAERLMSVLAAAVLLGSPATGAVAAPYRITYERTFTADELEDFETNYGPDAVIFGVTDGPALLQLSFTLDPALAPVAEYPMGSVFPDGKTAATDFYGYALVAASFGTQAWGLGDLNTSLLLMPLWMDARPVDGGTANLTIDFGTVPGGVLLLGSINVIGNELSLDQAGSVTLIEFQPLNAVYLSGEGGTTRSRALQPLPEPGTLALLALGLLPLWNRWDRWGPVLQSGISEKRLSSRELWRMG